MPESGEAVESDGEGRDSGGNHEPTEGNSLLSTNEIDKCVVLRMNKAFMEFMRKNYPEVLKSVHADDQPSSIDMG